MALKHDFEISNIKTMLFGFVRVVSFPILKMVVYTFAVLASICVFCKDAFGVLLGGGYSGALCQVNSRVYVQNK